MENAKIAAERLGKLTASTIRSATDTTTPSEWSDEIFKALYFSKARHFKQPTFEESASYAKSFLNFYVTGTLTDSEGLQNLLYGVTLSMRLNSKFIFDEFLKGDVSIPAPGAFTLKTATEIEANFVSATNRAVQDTTMEEEDSRIDMISRETIFQWYEHMIKGMEVEKDATPDSQWDYVSAIGFLSMTIMRKLTKDDIQVEEHIHNFQTDRVKNFWPCVKWNRHTPPPNKDVYTLWERRMKRTFPLANEILTYYVHTHCFTKADERETIQGILRAGCLLSLGELGLGLIHWVIRAAASLSISPGELLDYLYYAHLEESIVRTVEFCEKFCLQDPKELTWSWARIFKEGALIEMSLNKNPALALCCVAICASGDVNNDLWNISQIRKAKENKILADEAMKYARCLIRMINNKRSSAHVTIKAKELSAYMESAYQSEKDQEYEASNSDEEGDPGADELINLRY